MSRLGFAPAATAPLLGFGPVGWIAFGASIALPFLRFGSPRGNFQKFDAEIYPTLASLSKYTSLDTVTGWFNELVGVDADGQRKVYGSWLGEGPEWGDKAAAKIMELGRENFLWSFQPGRTDGPWVLVGPHPVLGSVVYNVLVSIQAAIDYWDLERAKFNAEVPNPLEPPPEPPPAIEPTFEPIDPGEVSAPPSDNPATGTANIDPPAPPPYNPLPRPRKRGLWELLGGILAGVLGPGGILGGGDRRRAPGYPGPGGGRYPGGPGGAPGSTFGIDNDYLYLAAAGLLLLAATRKRKRHGEKKTG